MAAGTLGLCIVVVVAVFVVPQVCIAKENEMTINNVTDCPGRNDFEYVRLDYIRNIFYGYMTIREAWNNVNVTGNLTKCVADDKYRERCDGEDIEPGTVTAYPGFCDNVKADGKIWSEIFKHTEGFPDKCPIKDKEYKFDNAPANLTLIRTDEMTADTYWQFDMMFSSEGKEVACLRYKIYINK